MRITLCGIMSNATDSARYNFPWEILVEWVGDVLLISCPRCQWKRGYPYMMSNILRLIIEDHVATCPRRYM